MKNKIDISAIKQKNKSYTIETSNIIGFKIVGNLCMILKMKVKIVAKYSHQRNKLIYAINGIDRNYFEKQYNNLINMLDDNEKAVYLKENMEEIYSDYKDKIWNTLGFIEIDNENCEILIKDEYIEIKSNNDKKYVISKKQLDDEYINDSYIELIKKDKKRKLSIKNKLSTEIYEKIYIMKSKKYKYTWICKYPDRTLNTEIWQKKIYESFLMSENMIDIIEINEIENGIKFENVKMINKENNLFLFQANINENKEESILNISEIGIDEIECNRNDEGEKEINFNNRFEKYNILSNPYYIKNKKLELKNDYIEHGFRIKLNENKCVKYVSYIDNEVTYDIKEKLYLFNLRNKIMFELKSSYIYKLAEQHKTMKILDKKSNKLTMFQIFKDENLNGWIYLGNYSNIEFKTKGSKKKEDTLDNIINRIEFTTNINNVNIFIPIYLLKQCTEDDTLIEYVKECVRGFLTKILTDLEICNESFSASYNLNYNKVLLHEINDARALEEEIETVSNIQQSFNNNNISIEKILKEVRNDLKKEFYDKEYIFETFFSNNKNVSNIIRIINIIVFTNDMINNLEIEKIKDKVIEELDKKIISNMISKI